MLPVEQVGQIILAYSFAESWYFSPLYLDRAPSTFPCTALQTAAHR